MTATTSQCLVTFSRNKKTGRFDVVGPVDQVQIGSVDVAKKDGTTKTVTVYKLSKPFVGKFGPTKGMECVFGTVGRADYNREDYCWHDCPVTGLKCCPTNGPCHDCQ